MNFALVENLLSLQSTLLIMMLVGAFCKKSKIIDENGKNCLTSLCMDVIIPCNIIKACIGSTNPDTLKTCSLLLLSGVLVMLISIVGNRFIYHRSAAERRKIMQYCTLAAMSGFFGNPIAEYLYGAEGVVFVSVFLIPMRITMWSVSLSYFYADGSSKATVLKRSLTNPGMVSTYIGLFLMLTQASIPEVVLAPIRLLGNCNTPMVMLLVGTFLADFKPRGLLSRDIVGFSLIRLFALPALAWRLGSLLGLDSTALSVSVFMSGAPAGATAPIFAARYGADAAFATQCVVFTTILSLITLPFWCYIV